MADASSVRSDLWSNEQKYDLRQREKWQHHSSKHNGQQEWQSAREVESALSSRLRFLASRVGPGINPAHPLGFVGLVVEAPGPGPVLACR
jgi:hypothetical protein